MAYGTTNFGYSGANASRCVYDTGTAGPPGIVSGGLTGADYEKSYGPYSGSETTSGALTFHVGTGSVTWGNATGFGPFTLDVDAGDPVDLVVQVNLAGDDVSTTYFVQPLEIGVPAAPGRPTAVKAAPGSASAAVSWTAPTSIGHSPITGYVVTPYIGSTAQTAHTYNSTATTQTVTGLTNKRTYTFHVAAKNAIGTGAKSVASAAIVVGVPKAPFNIKASSGSTTSTVAGIRVSYSAGSNNGSAVTKYTARCASSNGGVARGASHNGSAVVQIVVPKATVKKTYTCTVDATNAVDEPEIGRVGCSDRGRARRAREADRHESGGGVATCELLQAREQRCRDHQLHGRVHVVERRGDGHQVGRREPAHRCRSHDVEDLHVHGQGDQRPRLEPVVAPIFALTTDSALND